MQNDYARFLAFRETQRRLGAKFARPWLLRLHVIAFVVTMTAIWVYGGAWQLWFYRENFIAPVLVGTVWSLILAGHALAHYRHSAGQAVQRERAVEEEMRAFIDKQDGATDSASLFEMHETLENRLAGEGRWSASLTAFALINALSWIVGALNIGSSWPFQMTPIFAAVVIGGIQAALLWRLQRAARRNTWFSRLPLPHIFAYMAATVILGLLGALRAVNYWDVNTLVGWGLVAVIVYSIWCVLVVPVMQWLGGRVAQPEQAAKSKSYEPVTLSDDGELVALSEDDASTDMAGPESSAYEEAARGKASDK